MNPTARSAKYLRELGYIVGFTEQIIRYPGGKGMVRKDLFGFADLIAFKDGEGVLLIQSTTATNAAHRVEKARGNEGLYAWVRSGQRRAEVHGWVKRKNRWVVRVYHLRLAIVRWSGEEVLLYEISGGEREDVGK